MGFSTNIIIFPGKISIENATELQAFKFELLPGDVLQVMASIDAKCDVYELETGKLLQKDIAIIGSNSYQAIPVKPSNTPYMITFKVDDRVVSQKLFIFNNSNHLSIGGKND